MDAVDKAKGLNDFSLADNIQEILRGGPTVVVGPCSAKQVRVAFQKASQLQQNNEFWLIRSKVVNLQPIENTKYF